MEFATPAYAYFLLAVVTAAWLLRRHRALRNGFLLLVSYFFCWKWQPLFLCAIVVSSLWNYLLGEILFAASQRRRLVLGLGVAANVAFLGFFKYYGFFVDSLADLLAALGLTIHLPVLQIIAPLGVSFYTFQGIAYLVDAYRGQAVRPGSVLDFLLFAAFFPKLAAGPICRSHELLPQIMARPPDRVPDLSYAVALILGGLIKKMVLGTYLATQMVEDAFHAPESWSSLELWVVVFAYTAQIYLDFSGYTDIARGSGLLLGFRLPENFRYPYAAANIGDYWRRWHLSFSRWLRDYVYFPLGGSRRSEPRTYLNLLVTFTLCGIWHGARWGFVIWGLCHGVALVLHKMRLDRARKRGVELATPTGVRWLSSWGATLLFYSLVRIFFKARDLPTAGAFLAGLVGGVAVGHGFELGVVVVTVIAFTLNFVGQPIFRAFVAWHERIPAAARPLVWSGAALFLLTIQPHDVAFTIYFAF